MILVDLNVLLDVLQRREPHYPVSAQVISLIARAEVEAAIPAHAVTTLHYLLTRYQNRTKANELTAWVLKQFRVASVDGEVISRAQQLGWSDFEDAVVVAAAEKMNAEVIITRNLKDFKRSPLPVVSPAEWLANRRLS